MKDISHKYDKQTLSLIKRLTALYKENKLSDVDKDILSQLVNNKLTANDLEIEKNRCAADPIYFIDTWIWVKNKFDNPDTIPDLLKDKVVGDRIKFIMYPIQRELVECIFNDDKVISTKSRQIGFTTTTLACATQLISFNNNKTILLFSKSEKDAKDTLTELKFMYHNLPFFLRRNCYKLNEKEIILGNKMNGSKIIAQTSGRQSGRSHSATQLICDEADYIQSIENIYKAALFTISATKGKIIVLSTPNMHGSWFQRMVAGAKNKKNGFKLVSGEWYKIPWRDQKQYDEQCMLLNYDKKSIATELDMKQILPYDTYFNDDKLLSISSLQEIDIIESIVKLYNRVEDNNEYLISVDCQEEGSHYNAITVLNISMNARIEATCLTRLDIYTTILAISKYFNNAKIIIERNRGFYLIKKFEENSQLYLLLPNIKYINKSDTFEFDLNKDGIPNKYGFVTLKTTRDKLLIYLSEYVHKSTELPEDFLYEASKFIIKRGKAVGLEHDDLLMSTGIGLFTYAVLNEAKILKSVDSKLVAFFNIYFKDSPMIKYSQEKKRVVDGIKGQLNNQILKSYVYINKPIDYTRFKMLEDMTNKTVTNKLGNAIRGLF